MIKHFRIDSSRYFYRLPPGPWRFHGESRNSMSPFNQDPHTTLLRSIFMKFFVSAIAALICTTSFAQGNGPSNNLLSCDAVAIQAAKSIDELNFGQDHQAIGVDYIKGANGIYTVDVRIGESSNRIYRVKARILQNAQLSGDRVIQYPTCYLQSVVRK